MTSSNRLYELALSASCDASRPQSLHWAVDKAKERIRVATTVSDSINKVPWAAMAHTSENAAISCSTQRFRGNIELFVGHTKEHGTIPLQGKR